MLNNYVLLSSSLLKVPESSLYFYGDFIYSPFTTSKAKRSFSNELGIFLAWFEDFKWWEDLWSGDWTAENRHLTLLPYFVGDNLNFCF